MNHLTNNPEDAMKNTDPMCHPDPNCPTTSESGMEKFTDQSTGFAKNDPDHEAECDALNAAEVQVRKNVITFDDYFSLLRACPDDSRLVLIHEIYQSFESVEKGLAEHIRSMQWEAKRILDNGINAVYAELTSGSAFQQLGAQAAKCRCLVAVLGSMTRKLDDPEANEIDRFVHHRLNG